MVEVAEPVNLQEFLATAPTDGRLRDLAQQIRRELIQRLDLQRRVITGPVIKSREEVMELTLTDPALTRAMEHLAETEKKKLSKIKKDGPGLLLGDLRRLHQLFTSTSCTRIVTWLSRAPLRRHCL